jgi:hypothetical protein
MNPIFMYLLPKSKEICIIICTLCIPDDGKELASSRRRGRRHDNNYFSIMFFVGPHKWVNILNV